MDKPVVLMPFIYVYRFVHLVLKIPLMIVRYISLGIFFTLFTMIKIIVDSMLSITQYAIAGSVYLSYLVYRFISYPLKGILFTCYLVYRLLRYSVIGFTFPFTLIYYFNIKLKEKRITSKQARIERKKEEEKAKQAAQLKRQKEAMEKLAKIKAERKKEKANKEAFVDESVIIEKETISHKISKFFSSLLELPKTIVDLVKEKWENSTFVKNKRNKLDIERQALLISFEGEDAEKSTKKLVYEYVAKDANGKVIKGYFSAFSKVEVHSFLLSEGYEVYSIKTNSTIQFLHGESTLFSSSVKVKNKDLIFFLTQLSTYIKAGIPLVDSLKILARQYKKKAYQKLFTEIIYDLTMGDNFSDALSKQGNSFPKILINMVKTAEMTGELPEALDDLADYFTQIDKTRKQMVTAMMYPSIVFVVSIAVITFIMMFVIPKFVDIYEGMDSSKIPAFTKAVINVSDFLQNYIIWLFVGLIVVILLFAYLFKNVKAFKTIMQWIAMHIPGFGTIIIYNEVTTFTKTFASLLKHNVFITDSMEILSKITNNEIYKMLILDTITNLARGDKISLAFKNHWAFPVPAYEMLVTGEKTGQLPEMMSKVASYYQELHQQSVTRIKTLVEPLLIAFLTVMVGIIVLSIVIPMFNMYQTVQMQ